MPMWLCLGWPGGMGSAWDGEMCLEGESGLGWGWGSLAWDRRRLAGTAGVGLISGPGLAAALDAIWVVFVA